MDRWVGTGGPEIPRQPLGGWHGPQVLRKSLLIRNEIRWNEDGLGATWGTGIQETDWAAAAERAGGGGQGHPIGDFGRLHQSLAISL